MAESEDWRRQRALQLGLEPLYTVSTQSPPARPGRVAASQLQAPGDETGISNDGVYRMRPPNLGDAAIPEIIISTGPFGPLTTEIDPPAKRKPAHDFWQAPKHRASGTAIPIRRKRRPWPFLAGVALVAAIGSGWLAEQQTRSPTTVSASATRAAARSIPPAATLSAIPSAGLLQHGTSLPADISPGLPSCAAPVAIDQLGSLVTEQLRRSGLLRTSFKVAVDIAKPRIRIAEAGSALSVCTATLKLRPPAHKLASFDLDYVIRLPSGLAAQVVPLGLDRIVERIWTDDLNAKEALAKTGAGAAVASARMPDTTTVAARPASRFLSRVVTVIQAKPAVPAVAPPERGGFVNTASPVARPFDLEEKLPGIVHGCERPVTVSMSITCSSPALLALDAEVTTSLSALDHPGNTVELARIKQHADRHFDRCTTTSCVASAYRFWLNALSKIRQYEANYGGSGPDHATKRAPN